MSKTTTITNAFLNYSGRLSEGPTYNSSNRTLLWVDIIAGKVHRIKLPDSSEDEYSEADLNSIEESHEVLQRDDDYLSVIYLTENDDVILIGATKGIAEYNFKTKEFKYKFYYPENPKLRSNDGNVDPLGNIWAGLMGTFEYGPIKDGKVLKITPKGEITEEISNVLIPNGINWSKDGETLFWTSSLEFTIYKFKFDKTTGKLSDKQPFINFKKVLPELESPEPDGFALTEDNHIFTAVWSSSSILHFDENGQLVETFKLPAQRISAASFGGVDRDELFITSANLHLDDPTKLNENPEDLGGSIFRIKVRGQKGLLRPKFKSLG